MIQLSEYENKALAKLEQSLMEGKWPNEGMVHLLKLVGKDYLNLKTVKKYAEENEISYNGAKNHRNPIELFDNLYIVDNE